MPNVVEKVFLKLTSAIAVNCLSLKAGHIVEMVEHEAKDLLRRGKAVLATIEDHPQAAQPAPAPAPAPAPEDSEPSEPPANDNDADAKPAKGKAK